MASSNGAAHWLDEYGSQEYQWQVKEQDDRKTYYRPLGLVESTFDADGRYFEGRADMNAELDVEVRVSFENVDYRERVLFAWTCLRCKHLLLQAKTAPTSQLYGQTSIAGSNMCFQVDPPTNISQAVEAAGQQLVFLSDHFNDIDPSDFWTHCQNTARALEPERALCRLFVHRLKHIDNGRSILRFLRVSAHQIEDGLTTYTWFRDFVAFLNMPVPELRKCLKELLESAALFKRLPLPQEALYPVISGNKARQRWFWLLTRILRHVRKPLRAGFDNPLIRKQPQREAALPPPTYAPLLNYNRPPLLNALRLSVKVSEQGTQKLNRLCKEVRGSVGAGCFALTALIMMEMHEQREPDIPLSERRPFISGFPLNPRAFFNHTVEPDSLMLAFSDGIALPFLPSDLPLEGRLRLLIRQAHRQLAAYQKRTNPNVDAAGLSYMGSRGAGRILATQYISSVERMEDRAPAGARRGVKPQGAYPARPNMSMQTCGVSSVGRTDHLIRSGMYDLDDDRKDFVADFRGIHAAVRPRDGEFLVGIGGQEGILWATCSIDGNAIDPDFAEQWGERLKTVLEAPEEGTRSKL